MRLLVIALAVLGLLAAPAAEASRVAFLQHGKVVVLDLATGARRVAMTHAGGGAVRWSGDGQLVSSGGRIAGGPTLPTDDLVWAPRGQQAAYVTRHGGVGLWSPGHDRRLAPDGWGATSLAWSADGRLAIGRAFFGLHPHGQSIWVWDGRRLRLQLALDSGGPGPVPVAWQGGRLAWWAYPNSASIAADGVFLNAGRARLGETLMFPDYVARCGKALAFADGGDRYSTHGKRIVLGGRNVSRDPSRSWVSPSCSADGSTLVAAAGRNFLERRFGLEHRAIWQLLPARGRLTDPPAGWTDESPQVLPDGSVLFVRTRETSKGNRVTIRGKLELLGHGTLTTLAELAYDPEAVSGAAQANDYGHYGWPWLLAVSP